MRIKTYTILDRQLHIQIQLSQTKIIISMIKAMEGINQVKISGAIIIIKVQINRKIIKIINGVQVISLTKINGKHQDIKEINKEEPLIKIKTPVMETLGRVISLITMHGIIIKIRINGEIIHKAIQISQTNGVAPIQTNPINGIQISLKTNGEILTLISPINGEQLDKI